MRFVFNTNTRSGRSIMLVSLCVFFFVYARSIVEIPNNARTKTATHKHIQNASECVFWPLYTELNDEQVNQFEVVCSSSSSSWPHWNCNLNQACKENLATSAAISAWPDAFKFELERRAT